MMVCGEMCDGKTNRTCDSDDSKICLGEAIDAMARTLEQELFIVSPPVPVRALGWSTEKSFRLNDMDNLSGKKIKSARRSAYILFRQLGASRGKSDSLV